MAMVMWTVAAYRRTHSPSLLTRGHLALGLHSQNEPGWTLVMALAMITAPQTLSSYYYCYYYYFYGFHPLSSSIGVVLQVPWGPGPLIF